MSESGLGLRLLSEDSLASRLHAKRQVDDLTQAALAARFGVRQQTIGAWENGDRPQSRFFEPLAQYLGVSRETVVELLEVSAPRRRRLEAAEPIDELQANADAIRRFSQHWGVAVERGSVSGDKAAEVSLKLLELLGQ